MYTKHKRMLAQSPTLFNLIHGLFLKPLVILVLILCCYVYALLHWVGSVAIKEPRLIAVAILVGMGLVLGMSVIDMVQVGRGL